MLHSCECVCVRERERVGRKMGQAASQEDAEQGGGQAGGGEEEEDDDGGIIPMRSDRFLVVSRGGEQWREAKAGTKSFGLASFIHS